MEGLRLTLRCLRLLCSSHHNQLAELLLGGSGRRTSSHEPGAPPPEAEMLAPLANCVGAAVQCALLVADVRAL